jgi:hypothetical protein
MISKVSLRHTSAVQTGGLPGYEIAPGSDPRTGGAYFEWARGHIAVRGAALKWIPE